ncbi:MAG: iron-containing alcohol dehydrogenase [Bacteroidales bacterium]|nr:iron-containing alcohol dehydrogenase [Bacteroidales bacterium]
MENFEFNNPVKIFFGKGQIIQLQNQIASSQRIMLTYGGGSIFRNGVYDKVKSALAEYTLVEFGGIEPNPTHETCMKAVDLIRSEGIDFILAVGGGSVIDASKYIAAAVFQEDPWQILTGAAEIRQALPLGTVLTLPATGTEMNANSVISRKDTDEKLAFSSPEVMPRFSILDPESAASLPQKQVANGIVDSFVHVIEQYLTYPAGAPLQDRMAEAILTTLIEEGPKVYANPADYDAMANLMWCSTMALNGLISRGVHEDWVIHQIGHELTAFHGIDHARTLAIVLPGVWNVFRTEKKEKLLQYGRRVLNIESQAEDQAIDQIIAKTIAFFEGLGISTRLSAYGVPADTIQKIVDRFNSRGWLAIGDRGMTTPEKVREILTTRL